VQSVVWGINAFDQWGVELGKKIAATLLPAVASDVELPVADPVTQALLAEIHQRQKLSL
jgi:glucose-6-phosphate isomerase